MAEFMSTYQNIKYKVPESNKTARFNHGRFKTSDEQTISYLREHGDYGHTLTEVSSSSKSMTVGVHFCPVKGCGKVFKTQQALAGHMAVHNKDKGDGAEG